ncbi:hypothetical protein B0H13DRAFT_1912964 [Mycena leptocephala]|nr:hypothetical protein B0H13DRAFT_1912964 [Mycena leptocephala]
MPSDGTNSKHTATDQLFIDRLSARRLIDFHTYVVYSTSLPVAWLFGITDLNCKRHSYGDELIRVDCTGLWEDGLADTRHHDAQDIRVKLRLGLHVWCEFLYSRVDPMRMPWTCMKSMSAALNAAVKRFLKAVFGRLALPNRRSSRGALILSEATQNWFVSTCYDRTLPRRPRASRGWSEEYQWWTASSLGGLKMKVLDDLLPATAPTRAFSKGQTMEIVEGYSIRYHNGGSDQLLAPETILALGVSLCCQMRFWLHGTFGWFNARSARRVLFC